jgi:hypothetical protein
MASPTPSYTVSTPRGVCAVTGEAIAPGSPCVSLLVEHGDDERLDRIDVSQDAWQAGRRPAFRGRVVGQWRTVMPEKDRPRRQLIGDDEVLDLFEQLGESEDPKQVAFRYLLCLILIRKKLLVWEEAEPAGPGRPGLIRVRRRRDKDGPLTEVIDPAMDDEAIESATLQLSAVMNLDAEEA